MTGISFRAVLGRLLETQMLKKAHWANPLACSGAGLLGLGLAAIGAWVYMNSFFAQERRDIAMHNRDALLVFAPETALQELDSGQASVFRLVWQAERGPVTPPSPIPTAAALADVDTVQWTEADFQRVAFSSFPLLGSALEIVPTAPYGIGFVTPCEAAAIGPQQMEFDFWSEGVTGLANSTVYFDRRATVDARQGRVVWHETELSEASGPRQPITDRHLAAEMVLRAAEAAGGQAVRNQLADDCNISGTISRTSQWRVTYWVGDTQQVAMVIQVDATSGETRVLVTPAP